MVDRLRAERLGLGRVGRLAHPKRMNFLYPARMRCSWRAPALAIGLLFARAAVFAQAPVAPPSFGAAIERLAAQKPQETFDKPELLPPDFKKFLDGRGSPNEDCSNEKILSLYRQFQGSKAGLDRVSGGNGSKQDPRVAQAGKKIANVESDAGLRISGLAMGLPADPVVTQTAPSLRKGAGQPFDWDIQPRTGIDGVGIGLKYRHPAGFRSLTVGFVKHFDVASAIGLDSFRDQLSSFFGVVPDKAQGGFGVDVTGAVDQYLAGSTTYDQKQVQQGDRWSDRGKFEVAAGFSPVGDNPNKPWNYTLLGSLVHESLAVNEPGYISNNEGLGYSAGVAYQRALETTPLGGFLTKPLADKGDFQFDRLKTTVGVSQSAVSSFAVNTSVSVSVYLFKCLKLTPGIKNAFIPSPDPHNEFERVFNPTATLDVVL